MELHDNVEMCPERITNKFGQHRNSILIPLPTAHDDSTHSEIDVFHTQLDTFGQA
jgi:hypothetical protein